MKHDRANTQVERPGRRSEPQGGQPRPKAPATGEREQPASPRATRSSSKVAWQAVLILLSLAVILSGIATVLIVEMWLAARVLPGVYVWDVDVGGLTRQEAMDRLESRFLYPDDRYPTLRYGDRAWPVEPAHLGTQLDLAATVDTALTVGHRGDLLTQLAEQADVMLNGVLVMPTFSFDPGTGAMFLSQVARQVNRPPRDATLSLDENLSVAVIPGQVGFEIDEEATRQTLSQRISEMGGGDVDLVVQESEPLLADLGAAQAQVQRILSGPITLTLPDHDPWVIEPRTLASWLLLRPTTGENGEPTLTVRLDPGHATALAREIASHMARPPTNAQFRFDDASGSLVPVVDSMPGQTLDVTATVALVESTATSEQRTVSLPLLPLRPEVATEDAPNLGIVELIGEGKTGFAGSSASRVQNITVGAAQFDGA